MDLLGNDISNSKQNINDCIKLCTDRDDCVAAVYDKDDQNCWLKNTVPINDNKNNVFRPWLSRRILTKLKSDFASGKKSIEDTRRWTNCIGIGKSESSLTEECNNQLGSGWIMGGDSNNSEDRNQLRYDTCQGTHAQCKRDSNKIAEDTVNYISFLNRSTTTLNGYEFLPKVIVGGEVITNSTETELKDCINKCTNDSNCKKITYFPSSNNCVLKRNRDDISDSINNEAISLLNLSRL